MTVILPTLVAISSTSELAPCTRDTCPLKSVAPRLYPTGSTSLSCSDSAGTSQASNVKRCLFHEVALPANVNIHDANF